jgi:hypothetical protein
LLAGLALILALATDPLSPPLAADLDGDGTEESVTAAPARGAVRLEVRDSGGRKVAKADAPAPGADATHVELTAGPLGSPGSLIAVAVSTDAAECVSVWRFKDRGLARLPVRGADGKELPDCGRRGEWTWAWEREAEGRPSALVRERTVHVDGGSLRVREVFAFAGFSLDEDPRRSGSAINGVPIPAWYRAIFYARPALEILYGRFDLSRMRSQPSLSIDADRERGVFALRFTGPDGGFTAPVESSEAQKRRAVLQARVGEKTVRVSVSLGGDGSVPYEVEVAGLGAPFDQIYAPAGSWRGESRNIFPTAADEVAAEDLAGIWLEPGGRNVTIATEGAPPYRLRLGNELYAVDISRAQPPLDLLLLPAEPSGRPWGIVLRGPNTLERVPLACTGSAEADCRPEGPGEKLRRLGARMNIR